MVALFFVCELAYLLARCPVQRIDRTPPMLDNGYRDFQRQLSEDPHRFKTAVIHRRAGKTVFALDWLLEPCRDPDWEGIDGNPYRGYFLCPFRNQAKGIAFDFLQAMTAGDGVSINKSDLCVEFQDGGRVTLVGAEGYSKHRGKYAHRVACDETAQIPPAAWREVFRPMLADTRGEGLFIGTPRGRGWFHHLFTMPERSDSWASYLLRADESGIIDDAELADLQAELTDGEYRREFLCDWDVGVPGAYFTEQMDLITAENERLLLGTVHNESEMVWCSWALLPNDALAVCWWQLEGRSPVLIDSQRWVQAPIAEIVKAVQERPYIYGGHVFRIDQAVSHDQGKAAPFRMRQIRQLGMRGPIMPRREWVDEIQIMRQLLGAAKLGIEAAPDGVEALRQVHATWDEPRQVFSQEPDKDWTYDYAVAVSAFAAYWQRGKMLGRRDPIDYPARRTHG